MTIYDRFLVFDLHSHADVFECRLSDIMEKITYYGSFIGLYKDILDVLLHYVEHYLNTPNTAIDLETYVYVDVVGDFQRYLIEDYYGYFHDYDVRAGCIDHLLLPLVLDTLYGMLLDILNNVHDHQLAHPAILNVMFCEEPYPTTDRILKFSYQQY